MTPSPPTNIICTFLVHEVKGWLLFNIETTQVFFCTSETVLYHANTSWYACERTSPQALDAVFESLTTTPNNSNSGLMSELPVASNTDICIYIHPTYLDNILHSSTGRTCWKAPGLLTLFIMYWLVLPSKKHWRPQKERYQPDQKNIKGGCSLYVIQKRPHMDDMNTPI